MQGGEDLDGLDMALAALREPGREGRGKALRCSAEADFHATLGGGEGVIELGGIGEVAHAELIQPLERAGSPLPCNDDVHGQFLRVHE